MLNLSPRATPDAEDDPATRKPRMWAFVVFCGRGFFRTLPFVAICCGLARQVGKIWKIATSRALNELASNIGYFS
jgi:hypothetical protein